MKEEIKITLKNGSMPPISVKGNDTSVEITDSHSGSQNSIFLRYDELLELQALIDRYVKKIDKFNEIKRI